MERERGREGERGRERLLYGKRMFCVMTQSEGTINGAKRLRQRNVKPSYSRFGKRADCFSSNTDTEAG